MQNLYSSSERHLESYCRTRSTTCRAGYARPLVSHERSIRQRSLDEMTVQANDRVQSAFLQQQPIKMLIGGQWVEAASGKAFETIDPSTGQVLARVAEGDSEDINRAVTAARTTFHSRHSPQTA